MARAGSSVGPFASMLRQAMPRFETDDRFWEIEREGKRLRIRSGRLGEPGQRMVHTAHFEAEAARQYDQRIDRKLDQGYRAITSAREPVAELEPELADAVLDALAPERLTAPDGVAALREAWSVLGDWLATRGDVRGELIAIDETLTYVEGRGRDRLLARRDQLLAEWMPRWFGDFARLEGIDRPISLGWDHGFIAVARVGTEPNGLELTRYRLGLRDLIPVFEQLLDHPLTVALRQLRIGELDPRSRRDLARALPLLASATRPALIRLELGGVSRGAWRRDEYGVLVQKVVLARIGSLAPLARAHEWAPRLTALRIVGHEIRVLPALPQLRVLEIEVPFLFDELRTWLASGPWPKLERLWLRSAHLHDPWSRPSDAPELDDILDTLEGAPLTELGLQGPTALATLLRRPPLKLTELRLFNLGDSAVDLLLSAHDQLAKVDRIILEDTQIGRRWSELITRYRTRIRRCKGTFTAAQDNDGTDLRESIFDAPGWRP